MLSSGRPSSDVKLILSLLLFAVSSASAQTLTASAASSFPNSEPSSAVLTSTVPAKPSVEALTGPNFTVSETLQRDSSTGWSDSVTPDLSLRLNRHLALDVNVPWFLSLAAYVPTTVNGVTATTLTQEHNVIGDTSASAHADASHGDFNFSAGAAVGFPTGDKSLGVGAGTTTYQFGTHADYSVGRFTPDIEAGIGNSSTFANHLVHKSYTAVGGMANFQAGTSVDLPRKLSLDLEAYEAMPVQLQNVFGTISRRGNQGHTGGKRTIQGDTTSGEDNGFTADLGIPLTRKLSFSASYDRSFIQANDIVAVSLTWTLRAPKKKESDSSPTSPLSHPRR